MIDSRFSEQFQNNLILIFIVWNLCQQAHGGKYFGAGLPQPPTIHSSVTCSYQSLNNHEFAPLHSETAATTQVQIFLFLLPSYFQLQCRHERCEVTGVLKPSVQMGAALSYHRSRDMIPDSKCKPCDLCRKQNSAEFHS